MGGSRHHSAGILLLASLNLTHAKTSPNIFLQHHGLPAATSGRGTSCFLLVMACLSSRFSAQRISSFLILPTPRYSASYLHTRSLVQDSDMESQKVGKLQSRGCLAREQAPACVRSCTQNDAFACAMGIGATFWSAGAAAGVTGSCVGFLGRVVTMGLSGFGALRSAVVSTLPFLSPLHTP